MQALLITASISGNPSHNGHAGWYNAHKPNGYEAYIQFWNGFFFKMVLLCLMRRILHSSSYIFLLYLTWTLAPNIPYHLTYLELCVLGPADSVHHMTIFKLRYILITICRALPERIKETLPLWSGFKLRFPNFSTIFVVAQAQDSPSCARLEVRE